MTPINITRSSFESAKGALNVKKVDTRTDTLTQLQTKLVVLFEIWFIQKIVCVVHQATHAN